MVIFNENSYDNNDSSEYGHVKFISYSGEYSNVRDNLEQNPQELIVARRLLLQSYNKSKIIRGQ